MQMTPEQAKKLAWQQRNERIKKEFEVSFSLFPHARGRLEKPFAVVYHVQVPSARTKGKH